MIIYKATFLNGKSYIGKAKYKTRLKQHKSSSYNINDNSYYNIFHCAVRKYGWENVKWEILEDDIQDETILNERETFNILKYDTFMPNGYNMTLGGKENLVMFLVKNQSRNLVFLIKECMMDVKILTMAK